MNRSRKDRSCNVWVAANQADEIVVLNSSGRHIAKLGDFGGVDGSGKPIGLLFPASLVFAGGNVLVTNLAIDLRIFNPAFTTGDSAWTTQVTTHTVSKISATLPTVPGLP